ICRARGIRPNRWSAPFAAVGKENGRAENGPAHSDWDGIGAEGGILRMQFHLVTPGPASSLQSVFRPLLLFLLSGWFRLLLTDSLANWLANLQGRTRRR